jgi:hypothetical protein
VSKVKIILLVAGFLVTVSALDAQKGTAPNGYYPASYSGDTFTGTLQPVNKDSPSFSLVYTKNGKSETFPARLESKCKLTNKAGVTQSFGMEAFSEGAVLTAFYRTSKNKVTHEKESIVFALSFAEEKGTKIPDEKRLIVMCVEQSQLQFKSF